MSMIRWQMFEGEGTVPCPTITVTGPLDAAELGVAYSDTVSGGGGDAPYTYAVTAGALPGGLSLNVNTGAITGTPTTIETANFTITATDANACTGDQAFSIAVDYVSEVLDWVTRGGTGDATLKAAYNALAVSLRSVRVTNSKRIRLNMFADSAFANIFVPFLADLGPDTDTNNNFVSGDWGLATGLTGNGSNKTIDTGTNPTSVGMVANSGTLAVWNYTTGSQIALEMGGIGGGAHTYLGVHTVGIIYRAIGINGNIGGTVGTDTGLQLTTRNGDNDNVMYVNGSQTDSDNYVDATLANYAIPVWFGGLGGYSSRRLGCYLIADGLSAAEVTTLYNALVTFNTAIGR